MSRRSMRPDPKKYTLHPVTVSFDLWHWPSNLT